MDDLWMGDAAPRRSLPTRAMYVLKRAPLVLAVSLAAAGLTYVALLPDRYEAIATIELPQGAEHAGEVSRMLSQPVLALAVTRLSPALVAELRQSAGDTVDITALLARRVQIKGTAEAGQIGLVSVAQNPTSALDLANALASAYLSGVTGLPAPAAGPDQERLLPGGGPLAAPVDAKTQALEDKLAAARQARVALQDRADMADSLLEQGNFYALAREFDSLGTMVNRLQQLADLQGQRDLLSATLLSSHPKMRVLGERIATLTSQLRADGQQLADAVRSDIGAGQQKEAALSAQLASLQASSNDVLAAVEGSAEPSSSSTMTAGKLISTSVQPQQKLMAPAWGAALSGAIALLAQIALLLRLRRVRHDHFEAAETAFETSEQDHEELLEPIAVEATSEQKIDIEPAFVEVPVFVEADVLETYALTPEPLPLADAPPVADEILVAKRPEPRPGVPTSEAPASRVVIVSSSISFAQAQSFASDLLVALTEKGQRVAMVDAGSRLRTGVAGVSDLASGRAGYADVIQFDEEKSLTVVSWGRRASVDLDAEPIRILIKALGALCDVVIVVIGNADAQGHHGLLSMPGAIHTSADSGWDQTISAAA